ncbi:hypothetical protein B0H16DRAFT_1893818 [Mycena metata]|uniref:Uncharacterized protein n=1 Tax=Mycena metata TaxID=1033252 RepID=A0AAD7HXY1_9AGAR|nr:hypothetical protein B0H16DRAFT_1893818 [Mycena metata]
MHIPQLVKCNIPSSPNVTPFLKQNPSIVDLHIMPTKVGRDAPLGKFPAPPIQLPNLLRFTGSANSARYLGPHLSASNLTIYWGHDMWFSDCLTAYSLSNGRITELINLACSWNSALLPAIAQHMSGVEHLIFHHWDADLNRVDLPSLMKEFDIFGNTDNARWVVVSGAWVCRGEPVIFRKRVMDADAIILLKWILKKALPLSALTYIALENGEEISDFVLLPIGQRGLSFVSIAPDSTAVSN